MKHLTEVCYIIDKEDLLEKVNQSILNLINPITPKLSENDDLILRPKNQSNRKRKYNNTRPRKSKFESFQYMQNPSIHTQEDIESRQKSCGIGTKLK